MTSRIRKLTNRAVERIGPNGGDAVYWDGELTGFGVRVRASGRKNYIVQTRVRGKLRWFTIGPPGPLTADEARARAMEILALAFKGIDPREGEAQAEESRSVADLGRRFLEEYVPVYCKPSTEAQYRRMVAQFVDPAVGGLPVDVVQRKDIVELHYALRETPYQANPDARAALENVHARRDVGLAPGRREPLPSRQELQGAQARAVSLRTGDRAPGRRAARPGGGDAVGRSPRSACCC